MVARSCLGPGLWTLQRIRLLRLCLTRLEALRFFKLGEPGPWSVPHPLRR